MKITDYKSHRVCETCGGARGGVAIAFAAHLSGLRQSLQGPQVAGSRAAPNLASAILAAAAPGGAMRIALADVLLFAILAGKPGVRHGARIWRVRWPTGMVETVREVLLEGDAP